MAITDKSNIFLSLVLSFIFGILIASFLKINFVIEILITIIGLFLIGVFWSFKEIRIIGFCFLFICFGIFNYNTRIDAIENNELVKFDNQAGSLIGIVSSEIDRGLDKSKIMVDVLWDDAVIGKILVNADKYVDLNYRDKILLTGVLKKPGMINNFDYQGYLAKDGISMTMNYPQIELLEHEVYSNWGQMIAYQIYRIKDLAKEEIKKDVNFKEGAIIQGIILGDSNRIDDNLKKSLSISGLSHVVAISGSHIVLFSAMLFELLLVFGLWRKQAQVAVIIFSLFYVFMTGMLPSAVRSVIMISLMLIAQIIDRNSSSIRTLILAAGIMSLQNPLIIKFDLGFQLSFLAVLGLIYAGPIFNFWLSKFIKWNFIREATAMTLSAELFTIPVLINAFGYFSVVSIFNNIIVEPIVPIIMATGIIFPFIGIIFHSIGFAIGLICQFFTYFMVLVIEFSNYVPFSIMQVSIPIIYILIFYIPIIYWIIRSNNKKDLDFLKQ